MKIFHSFNVLLLMVVLLLPFNIYAQEERKIKYELRDYQRKIRYEYNHYAHYDDDSYFPQDREQEILTHLEDYFLKDKPYQKFYGDRNNPLVGISSIAMARLFLRYGGNVFDVNSDFLFDSGITPLAGVSIQEGRLREYFIKDIESFSHDEFITEISKSYPFYYRKDLATPNAIALIKLYLSLGAKSDEEIPKRLSENASAIEFSLYHNTIEEGGYNSIYIWPDDKHRADDIKAPIKEEYSNEFFYRSPVTYWLEEFIESGYPAEMLDTHKLHYPYFMNSASVENVKNMLDNPKAHAIKTNINCNEDAKGEPICPLTPSINMKDAMGRTPLHIAGNEGNEDVFNYLKNNGADTSIMDYRNNLATLK